MNTRLQQFLSAENISQAQFADRIGVARASVSHILSGRNKPGFDFIERMARCFPTLSLDWLVGGKGRMYKDAPEAASAQLSLQPGKEDVNDTQPIGSLFPEDAVSSDTLTIRSPFRTALSGSVPSTDPTPSARRKTNGPDPKISRIIVLYADGSFQEFK